MIDCPYSDFIESLGYSIVRQLHPSSCQVYLIEKDGESRAIKIGEGCLEGKLVVTNVDWCGEHVRRDNEALERARGIEGIAQKVSYHEFGEDNIPALVKDFIEGRRMGEHDFIWKEENQKIIRNAVRELHERGMCHLEWQMRYFRNNVIQDSSGKPYIVDLGYIKLLEEGDTDRFQFWAKVDLQMVEMLIP